MPNPRGRPPQQSQAIGDQLRAAIRESGLTVNALAVEAGVQPKSLGLFLRGEAGLSLDTLDRLAGPLGLKLIASGRGRGRPRR